MRFKIVACILLILSVFSFVLAAPVAVREVCERCVDAAQGGEDVIVVSGKQAPRGYPYEGEKSDLYPTDLSDTEGTPPSHSSPPPDYASGSHLGVDLPSSPSGGTEAPLDSKGAFKPETTTDNQLESSSKQKKVQFWHTTKVHFYEPDPPLAPEDRPPPTTKVQWGHTTKVHFFEPDEPGILPPPPGRDGYLVKVATQKSPSSEIELASPSSYFEPPPPPPPSNGFVSKFKTFFGKLGKLNFRPRFQRTEPGSRESEKDRD